MTITRRAMLFSAAAPLMRRTGIGQVRPLFTFHNRFWLNLHHFLYVLGRAKNNTSDSKRGPVVGAINDGNPREALSASIEHYSKEASTKDTVFDRPFAALTKRIASIDDNDTPPDDLGFGVAQLLRDAAPA